LLTRQSQQLSKEQRLLAKPFDSLDTYGKQSQQIALINSLLREMKLPEGVTYKFLVNSGTCQLIVNEFGTEYVRQSTTDADLVFYYYGVPVGHVELNHFADNSYRDSPRLFRMFDALQDQNPFVKIKRYLLQQGGKWFSHLSGLYWHQHDVVALHIRNRVPDMTRQDKRHLQHFLQRIISNSLKRNKYTGDEEGKEGEEFVGESGETGWCECVYTLFVDYAPVVKREFDYQFLYSS
jgi:hypothetical protein